MDSTSILGIASALMVLSVFVANQYGKLTSESIWYDSINLLGSLGLFYYAYQSGVVPFMLTNGVWALVSGVDVVRYALKPKRLKNR